MTNEQLEYLSSVTISRGSHLEKSGMTCGIEAISRALGSKFSDHEESVCPVIGAFYRPWQDSLPDDETRSRLCRPLLFLMIGTKSTPEVERQRAFLCADYAVRVFAPLALDAAGLTTDAERLRSMSPVTDKATADAANAAADAANAADYAYSAADATYSAANATYSAANAAFAAYYADDAADAAFAAYYAYSAADAAYAAAGQELIRAMCAVGGDK